VSLIEFIQLIIRNKKWVLYFPLIVGLGVFVLTRNTPHTYTSEMVIYTGIASGFNPDNDFENKVDFHAVNSRFDNLINIIGSRETQKNIGIKLLAHFLHNREQMNVLIENSKNSYLTKTLDESFIKKHKIGDELETESFLAQQLDSGSRNTFYQLVYGDKPNPFNIKTLNEIKAVREGNSDMLKISFTSEDPYTCKKTLDITSEIFLKKYQNMRIGEANQAVKYFRDQTALAKIKLQVSEENLKKFRTNNRVINYYEQTKYIADQNENIENNTSQLQMELLGLEKALAKVEEKIGNRFQIILQSDKIVQTRGKLSEELTKNGVEAVKNGSVSVPSSPQIENLKGDLKSSIERLYALNNSTEGMPGKNLLEEWLKLTVSKEETAAKLHVLTANKVEFDKVFDRYAPMGSELSKLEREVETAEKEYLNLLHNLNQAILREQNLEVSETVSIIDEADLPVIPNPSKRFMLVIASVLSCLVIVVTLLIIRKYIDNSIGSPMRLEELTGIKTSTAFLINKFEEFTIKEMDARSLDRWHISLIDDTGIIPLSKSILTVPFNCNPTQMQNYIDKLNSFISVNEEPLNVATSKDFVTGEQSHCVVVADKIFPKQQPKQLLGRVEQVYLFFDAAEKLDEYQMQIIEEWKTTGTEVLGILVNTDEQPIGKYLGEIPIKRSKLRTYVKKQFMRYAG
jgi:succinoglycan biosynthesis transport protein ExoP